MSDDLQGLRDAVLMRFGRNLLMCQQIEAVLKDMLKCSRFEGSAAAMEAMLAKRAERLHTSTLGLMVGAIKNDVLSCGTDEGEEDVHEDVPDDWVSFRRRIHGPPDFVARRVDDLDWLLTERNALAHHFFPRWCPHDPEGLRTAICLLDEQLERLQRIREDWVTHLKSWREDSRALASWLLSPEADALIEAQWWGERPTLKALKDCAAHGARTDGWTYVSLGAKFAREQAPEEVAQMRELYGVRTFTELLKAYPDFEVKDEVLPNDSTRTLYRMRPVEGACGPQAGPDS
ncbi:hypothetical protein METUNv1_00158 [Methyloversatilis universalis FAM5]|uniref:HTH OST-type domain-containing protein n=1 Tax=Methyloversatilis universalis (strain ATCC BAA-1314 / DSM 25237 / JCM 13912 / CCUG 52030 / FAM5) TaxID=1000565 RepID=F5R7E4_METUF|nr:hypothetical protein [Methyloversatilis universalis]EGK73530.1 hypothetical protein METUNv1_00158 [Methyloversatilis universalis FAM5]